MAKLDACYLRHALIFSNALAVCLPNSTVARAFVALATLAAGTWQMTVSEQCG